MTVRGSCLCGACGFVATPTARESGICHCRMCQVWSGGMFLGVEVGGSLIFDEGAPVGRYASSDWGARWFCTRCGSSLAWTLADGTHGAVSAHALAGGSGFPVTEEIFVDDKPDAYALAGERRHLTGAEVMARVQGT